MQYQKTQTSHENKDTIPDDSKNTKNNTQPKIFTPGSQITFGKYSNSNNQENNSPETVYQNIEERKKINIPKKYQKDLPTPLHNIFCAYDNVSDFPRKQTIGNIKSLIQKSDDISEKDKEKKDEKTKKYEIKKPRKSPPSKLYDVLSHYKNNTAYSETNNIFLMNKSNSPKYDDNSYQNNNVNNYLHSYNYTSNENLPLTEVPSKRYKGYTYTSREKEIKRNFSPSDEMSPKENYDLENYSSNDNKNQNILQNKMKGYLANTYNNNYNRGDLNYDNQVSQTDYAVNIRNSCDAKNKKYFITNKQYPDTTLQNSANTFEAQNIKKILPNYYDPKIYNSGYLVEKSQEIYPPNFSYYNTNKIISSAKGKKLSNILLAKNNNKLKKKFKSCTSTPHKIYKNENTNFFKTVKNYSNNSYKSNPDKSLILNKSSPKKKFLYVSLAMLSSKGPNTENRTILRKMRLDKGGVVDLAQVKFTKNKFKIARAINKGNSSISPFKGGIKGRERAAKIIQSWWRNLKILSLYYLKQVVLIQSMWRGSMARKNIFDLLSINYLILNFCKSVENVLAKNVKKDIFYRIFMGKIPQITEQDEEYNIITTNNNLEDLEVQNYLIYLLRKIVENKHIINLSIIHKYLYKWYCITKNENLINAKGKSLLQIRAEKDSKLNLLRSAFTTWVCQTKILKIKDKFDQIESKSSRSFSRNDSERKLKSYENNKNKFIGLFKIIDGTNKINKKNAFYNSYDEIKSYLIRLGRENKLKNILKNENKKLFLLEKKYFNRWYNKVNKYKNKDNMDEQNNKILEIKAVIFKTIMETSANKIRKNILRKYLYRFFRNALLINPEIIEETKKGTRRVKKISYTYNKEEIIKIKGNENLNNDQSLFLDKIRKVVEFSDIIKKILISNNFPDFLNQLKNKFKKEKINYCLFKLLKIKKNNDKNLLKQAFDKWKYKTLKKTNISLVTKLFIKIFGIMQKNHIKRLLRKKLYQWSKKSASLNNINQNIKSGKKIFLLSESLINYNKKKNGYQLLETLRNIYNTTRHENIPKNRNQMLRNHEILKLKGKLLYTLYNKYKMTKLKDDLLKYLRRWRNYMLYFEKITYKIEIENEPINDLSIKEKRIIILKSIIRNLKNNLSNKYLRKYLFLWWKNAFKKNKINEIFTNKINTITKTYVIKKNAKKFFTVINKPLLYTKRKRILLRLVSKINNRKSYLLLKNLLRWKNKTVGIRSSKPSYSYTKMYIGVLMTKNDKENLQKVFTKWRLFSSHKDKYIIVKNVYQLAMKKIKQIACIYAFNLLKRYSKYKNTYVLNSKGKKLIKIFKNISVSDSFKKFISLTKLNNRINQLSKFLPEVNKLNRKKLLKKYIHKWHNNTKKIRSKSLQKISVWIKKTAKKDKDNKDKRIKELLRRFIDKFQKSNKYKLYYKFYLWRKLALIISDRIKANIIRDFCYESLVLRQPRIVSDIKYKRLIKLRDIVEAKHIKYLYDLFIRKFDYWRNGNVIYIKKILLIQNHIRRLFATQKLRNIKRLNELLIDLIGKKHLINRNKFLTFLRKWMLTAYTMKCRENMDIIQRFSRKMVIMNFYYKTKSFFERLAKKYILYYLTNIKSIIKLSDVIKRKIYTDSFNRFKKYILNNNIRELLIEIIQIFDKKNRKNILRSYMNKWFNNSKNISDKEILYITRIQKIFRGYLVRNKINKKININNLLLNIVNRRGITTNLLRYKFYQWNRIARNLLAIENAAIIQNFVRKIMRRIASIKNQKNKIAYKNLSKILIKIKITPNDFIRRLKIIARNQTLKKLLDKVVDKKKHILKDAGNTLKNYAKYKKLYKIIILIDELKKNNLKNLFNYWKNKAVSYKKILKFLLIIYNKKNNNSENYKYYTFYRWNYIVRKIQSKENANIIKDFCKRNIENLLAHYKWLKLSEKLFNNNKINEIRDITEKIKIIIGFKKLGNVIKMQPKKDIFTYIKRVKYVTVFIDKIKYIIDDIERNKNRNILKKFLLRWKNAINKKLNKEDTLKEMFDILDMHSKINNLNVLNNCFLIKKIFSNLMKIRTLYFIKKLRSYNNYNKNYEKLYDSLQNTKNEIYDKHKNCLLTKIYKIYVSKTLNNLTKNINDKMHKKRLYYFKKFIINLKHIKNKSKEFSTKKVVVNVNLKPQITQLKFKTKTINSNKKITDKIDNKLIYYKLLPDFTNFLNIKICQRKEYSFNKIKNANSGSKFFELYKTYIKKTQIQFKREFFNKLKNDINEENKYIKYTIKLYKLFKKLLIKKIYKYSKEAGPACKILELIKIIQTHKKIARDRWLLKLIKKWRLMTFIRATATKKMGLMYKNLHSNYMEMANSILGEDGPIKKSDVDKLARLDIDKYLYNVKDPWVIKGGKICEEVKNKYIFPPIKLDEEKKVSYEEYIKVKGINLSKLTQKEFRSEDIRRKKGLSIDYLKKKYTYIKNKDKI